MLIAYYLYSGPLVVWDLAQVLLCIICGTDVYQFMYYVDNYFFFQEEIIINILFQHIIMLIIISSSKKK